MTDAELSRQLALAIGWPAHKVRVKTNGCWVQNYPRFWRYIDYRDPLVIWPIAELYGLFPSPLVDGDFAGHKRRGYPTIIGWEVFRMDCANSTELRARYLHYTAPTAAEAVARAVVGART